MIEGEIAGEAASEGDTNAMPMPVETTVTPVVEAISAVPVAPALPEVPMPVAPAVVSAPQAEPVAVQIEAPAVAVAPAPVMASPAPTPAPVSAAAPIPVVAPAPLQLDWSSGLTQIETDHSKTQTAHAISAASEVAPRPRRARPVLPAVAEEPLMQVETQRSAPPA